MTVIAFWAAGRPAPQGSKRNVGRRGGPAVLIEQSKYVKPWRTAVTLAGAQAMAYCGADLLDGPLSLDVTFFLDRPARPKFDQPAVPPDLSKLIRSTEDAMTGVVWTDDARVVDCRASKRYAPVEPFLVPGAYITVTTLTTTEGDQP